MSANSETPIGYSGSPTIGYRRDGAGLDAPRVSLAEIEALGPPVNPASPRVPWMSGDPSRRVRAQVSDHFRRQGDDAPPRPERQSRDKRSTPIPEHIVEQVAKAAGDAFDAATAGLTPEKPGAAVEAFLGCVREITALQRPADRGRVSRALATFFGAL